MDLQLGELWVLRRDPQDLGLRERWWLTLYEWWDHHEAVRLGPARPGAVVADASGPVWLGQINRVPRRDVEGATDLWLRLPVMTADVRVWVNGTEVKGTGPAGEFNIGELAYQPRSECELKPPEGEFVLTVRLGR
ncbi:MAG: hypothetical protein IT436_03670 [Phycisphaerales bacterium]|nr:hypothetical protein [Phycisphaerales bacterium]